MKLSELQEALATNANIFPRFILPNGDYIPTHAHITEVGHVVRNFIDCGGMTGREEKAVLQSHVAGDIDHRLTSERFSKILELGSRVLPNADLDVELEYDCCVVGQYPIAEARAEGQRLDLILGSGRTRCRARERREVQAANSCCGATTACC